MPRATPHAAKKLARAPLSPLPPPRPFVEVFTKHLRRQGREAVPAFLPGRTPGSACRAGAVVDFRGRIEKVAMYRARREYKAAIFPILRRQARRSGSPFGLLPKELVLKIVLLCVQHRYEELIAMMERQNARVLEERGPVRITLQR